MKNDTGMNFRNLHKGFRLNFPVILFLLIPFFEPACLEYLAPLVDVVFDWWLAASAVTIVFLYILNRKVSGFMLAVLAFEASLALSTIVNSGDIRNLMIDIVKVIPICMLVELGSWHASKELVKAFVLLLGIECAVNSVTIFMFPNGMYISNYVYNSTTRWHRTENFFLGYDNSHILYLIPFLSFFWIYSVYKGIPKIVVFIIMVLFSITTYITWSATSVAGVTVFLFLFLVARFRLWENLLNPPKMLLIVAITFLVIVIFRFQNWFSPIIVDVMGKDLTFTGRTKMWDCALNLFYCSPILGNGVQLPLVDLYALRGPNAHNYILQILYQNGIVGLGCFVWVMVLVGRKLRNAGESKYGFALSVTVFCWLIAFLFEVYNQRVGFWVTITLAYHIQSLTEGLGNSSIGKDHYHLAFGRHNCSVGTKPVPRFANER